MLLFFSRVLRMWTCDGCGELATVHMGEDFNMYCDACWRWHELQSVRCFSFATLYDLETGQRLSFDASDIGIGCAERLAMWKLQKEDMCTPKAVIVARIRRNREKITFGDSKPCKQCIQAMAFYGVERICYSTKTGFKWEDAGAMANEYTSCSNVLVKL